MRTKQQNLRMYLIAGWYWLGLRLPNGRLVLVQKLGRENDCVSA